MKQRMAAKRLLLSIVELGGYPDFSPLYRRLGYEVRVEGSMRRALSFLKKTPVDVVIAEFNYQSGFRDRVSNLESLMAAIQRIPGTRVIVFYEEELVHQFDRVRERFDFSAALRFPVDEDRLAAAVGEAPP